MPPNTRTILNKSAKEWEGGRFYPRFKLLTAIVLWFPLEWCFHENQNYKQIQKFLHRSIRLAPQVLLMLLAIWKLIILPACPFGTEKYNFMLVYSWTFAKLTGQTCNEHSVLIDKGFHRNCFPVNFAKLNILLIYLMSFSLFCLK